MKGLQRYRWWHFVAALVVMSMLFVACAGPNANNLNNGVADDTMPPEDPGEPADPAAPPPAEEDDDLVDETPTPDLDEDMVDETPTPDVDDEDVAPEPDEDLDGAAARLNTDVSGNVEFWHFWGSPVRRSAIRAAVAMCEEKLPNIEIEEVFKPWGDIWTANISAVAAGSGMPDVIVENRPQLPQRAVDDVTTNLQPYIDQDNLNPDQFWSFTWEETLYEGDSYGVPFETDVRVFFWNKQAFEEAGLDPERPPETWDELWEYADALDIQREDGTYERIAFFPLWNAGPDFWAYNNSWEPVVDGRPNVDDPAYIETLEWINQWIDRYGDFQSLQNYQGQFSAPPNDLFMSGAVAMFVDVAGYHSILSFYRPQYETEEGDNVNMEWGIGPIPYNTERGNWSGGFALSIPRGAENADAAWEVIKCMTGPEVQLSWTRDTYAIPTNEDAAYSRVMMSDPYWEAIIENMEYSRGSDYVPEYPNWTEQVGPVVEEVWRGTIEPEAAAEQIQTAIDRQMGQ
jgi:multiple sugar transport system substrate-binding protein